MNKVLKNLLQNNPAIWCASESVKDLAKKNAEGLPTGFNILDEILPTHGWPVNTLVDVLLPRWGIGELQLLLPVFVAMTQQQKRITWIAPPYIPYAPALAHAGIDLACLIVISREDLGSDAGMESLWAMEKILRNPSCGIAMLWPQNVNDKAMRRLQVAAEEGKSLGFIFRNYSVNSSPAALRISIEMVKHQLQITILKARGASRYRQVLIDLPII